MRYVDKRRTLQPYLSFLDGTHMEPMLHKIFLNSACFLF